MGLDMDLYRFPRYKGYTAKNIVACDKYYDWLENPEGKKHTFSDWCGIDEKDLPRKEDMEHFKEMRAERYWAWDEEHRYPHTRVYDNVAYWRKANAIHKWFVDHVQGGEDDCEFHDEVTESVLEELRDACKKVMESTVLVPGKVKNGYRYIDGKEVPIYEDGKIVLNDEICRKYLPCERGFFFGSMEYNEWYMEDVKYTYEVCNKILEETDFEKQMIFYRSSW